MRRVSWLGIVSGVAIAFGTLAYAATPFDGTWSGNTQSSIPTCGVTHLSMTISDGVVTGQVVGAMGTGAITHGAVKDDGTVTIVYGTRSRWFNGTVKLSGQTLVAELDTFCGIRKDVKGARKS